MRAAANALRENGLKRREVIYLSKRYPPLLSRSSTDIKNALTFFRYQCGLQKDDVMPFISRYPAVLGLAVTDLQAKVTYLYQSLGGTPGMVKKFPAFFSFDLDTHIRPRAEFLRALGIDPLGNGLSFLLTTSVSEFTKAAGVKSQLFNEFQLAYLERWKRKKILEKGSADFANLRSAPLRIVPIEPAISTKSAKPTGGSTVEVVLDELDFGF